MHKIIVFLLLATTAHAATVTVVDEKGQPMPTVMVKQAVATAAERDLSDNGYQTPGVPRVADIEITKFTDGSGRAEWPARATDVSYRARKFGYADVDVAVPAAQAELRIAMQPETDATLLAASIPANAWLGALDLGSVEDKQHFQMQCGFCHQFGTALIRVDRPPELWSDIIKRMVRYGSRLPTDLQKAMPERLRAGFKKLAENPSLIARPPAWSPALAKVTITEWPLGDAMSQEHDMLLGNDHNIFVADNIQDRLYETNLTTNAVTVYKIPHRDGEPNGGLIRGRLKEFPKHDSTSNAHSLAMSKVDGHIFITPSAQRRLVEFDPKSKTFILHEMPGGFYPHTIRIDQKDRVWYTLALSNQVAMYDRKADKFTLYDLPTRSLREKIIVKLMAILFKFINWGIPLNNWLPIDRLASGTPMPYGIDVAPDGSIWFARLHTREIGRIDGDTGAIKMIPTPFLGPRRLRADENGNLWIGSYAESKIARYNPRSGEFTLYDLPVIPKGSETPYALNVDKKRGVVWVNGNQSDSLYALDISKETWRQIPLPRRTSFTRDVEIDEDGTVYTSNSNFPSWHIEGAQPTLFRIEFK